MASAASNRRRMKGEVIKTAMDKTAVVQVTRRFPHPVYKKYVTRMKKFYAHDEQNAATAGDQVIIEETRPLSKTKRWRILEIIGSAKGGSAA